VVNLTALQMLLLHAESSVIRILLLYTLGSMTKLERHSWHLGSWLEAGFLVFFYYLPSPSQENTVLCFKGMAGDHLFSRSQSHVRECVQ
jgi:hypothetical protein